MPANTCLATIYYADGSYYHTAPANYAIWTIEELQEIVGGYFQLVTMSPQYYMVVNEDGIALDLPINEEASKFWPTTIRGNVLICPRSQIS